MGAQLRFARRGCFAGGRTHGSGARFPPADTPPREVKLRPIARYQVELGNELKDDVPLRGLAGDGRDGEGEARGGIVRDHTRRELEEVRLSVAIGVGNGRGERVVEAVAGVAAEVVGVYCD